MAALQKRNYRLLKIAGFVIKINLLSSELEETRQKIADMIDSLFGNFSAGKDKTRPVFFVDVRPTVKYFFFDRDKDAFVKLYSATDNERRITTFYSISLHQFQLILMQVIFWLLSDKGFIAHCSAVKTDKGAVVFVGKQGAGKSTASKLLSKKYEVLADDHGIIKKESGEYYFYQSSNIEKNRRIVKSSRRYPVRAIFFLRKSAEYKTTKIGNKELVLKKITQQILGDQKDLKQKVEFLFDMVNNFDGFYYLHFGKNRDRLEKLIENGKY